MKLPFFIARRYFFAKKSRNAINIISIISVVGIAVATAAMVCVLSGFNGFGGLIEGMFNAFDPDLKITAKEGKVFRYDTDEFNRVLSNENVDMIAETLDENALLQYGENSVPVLLRGVSPNFSVATQIDNLIIDGAFKLREDVVDYTTLGAGLAMNLGIRPGYIDHLDIYAPKRNERVNLANPSAAFNISPIYLSGVFSLNQAEYDEGMALIPIELARELFDYDNEVSALNVKLTPQASASTIKKQFETVLGDGYLIEDRYEQQKESYRMLQIEKWVSFLILSLIVLISVFNIVGSLTMLIVEKQDDIKSLTYLGASNRLITQIFLFEGWIISFIGIALGVVSGVVLCFLQQEFGFLKLSSTPGMYIVDAYPIKILWSDIVVVFLSVCAICGLTVLYPIYNLRKKLNSN